MLLVIFRGGSQTPARLIQATIKYNSPNASTHPKQYLKSNHIISSKLPPSTEKHYHRLTKKHWRHKSAAADKTLGKPTFVRKHDQCKTGRSWCLAAIQVLFNDTSGSPESRLNNSNSILSAALGPSRCWYSTHAVDMIGQ